MNSLFFNILAKNDVLYGKGKIISLFTAFLLITIYSFSQTAVMPSSGDGTPGNPYQITSLENLYWISTDTANWKHHYLQVADIDASATSGWDNGKGWSPIGNSTVTFKGKYEGNGHTLTGLYLNRPDDNFQGLFGYTNNSVIANLTLTGCNISGRTNVGGLIGYDNNSSITNCHITGNINGTMNGTGGLFGSNYRSVITGCSSSGNVGGLYYLGGLTGSCSYTEMTLCYSGSVITGTKTYVGGLTGRSSFSVITSSYSTGNVTGDSPVGGLVGQNSSSEITDCYSKGNVNGTSGLGGFVGANDNSVIKNCYSTGSVESNGVFGGFAGASTNSDVKGCFWDTETSGQLTSAGGTGKTTAEMKTFSVFANAGWDFKDFGPEGKWNIGNGRNVGYPYLSWQFPGDEGPDELSTAHVTTIKVSNLQGTSAVVSCVIVNIGNPIAFHHGVCWNTNGNPTIFDDHTLEGPVSSAGEYYSTLTGLAENTSYYVRAYIINEIDTTYGNELYFISCVTPEGSGTEEDPFRIASLAHLHWLDSDNTMWDKHFKQVADIDAQSASSWNEGKGWLPLGNQIIKFTGSYNGNGHTINGLYINRIDADYQGFFGYADSAFVSGLGLTNLNITGKSYFGGLAGGFYNSVMSDCHTTGIVNGSRYTGGLTGYNNRCVINNCFSTCEVNGTESYTGGLTGINNTYSTISNSYFNGIVSGSSNTGGITGGSSNYSVITICYNSGSVTGANSTGGLTGTNTGNSSVNQCFNIGQVSGNTYVGGIAGLNSNYSLINNSYNMGSVTGTQYVGGVTGNNNLSQLINVYNTGLVPVVSFSGGLTGNNNSDVIASFWDTETSGQPESYGGTGLSTAGMKMSSNFTTAGWDFKGLGPEEIWNIGNLRNDGYPYLDWQFPGDDGTSDPSVALVNTISVIPVSANSVNVTAAITNTGNPKASQHGVCWNTAGEPTIANSKTQEGAVTQPGNYISSVTGLNPNTTYHARAYITNDHGTNYGRTVSFITSAFPSGSGTSEDPFLISSLAHLFWMACDTARWNKHYKQISDINATPTQNWNEGEGWIPVGNDAVPFSGNYNGNGYAIDGLFINRENSDRTGLFGILNQAVISNIRLINVNIIGRNYVSGLAGEITLSDISNSVVSGNLSSINMSTSNSYVGFIVGRSTSSNITGCYAEGFFSTNSQYVGGLAGYCSGTTIRNSFTSGNINGRSYVGGLVGYQSVTHIYKSYGTGTVGGEQISIGGLAGYQTNSTISNSYYQGDVSGSSEIGGLVGSNVNNSRIVNSYSTGNVYGNGDYIGGLVGRNVSSFALSSFWNTETSGQLTSEGGTGKTTSEMRNVNTFTSLATEGLEEPWDFTGNPNDDTGDENIWGIISGSNNGYPYLTWQYCGTYTGEFHPGVTDPIFPPDISNQPEDTAVCPLTSTSFRVDPVYEDAVTKYQWQMKAPEGNWGNVTGAMFTGITARELILTGITSGYNNYQFRCILSNVCGPSATSDPATLTVITAPDIITHPQGKTVCEGGNTSMTVEATGYGELQYRWKKEGNNITSWSTSPQLILENALISAAGNYTALVRDGCGNTEESNSAVLTVNPKPIVSLGADKHLCPGANLILDPGAGYSSYLWSTGAATQTISVNTGGDYSVTVSDNNNCFNQAGVSVIIDPDIPAPDLGDNIDICMGEARNLDTGDQYDTYLWSTGAETSSILVSVSDTYWVDVKNNNSVCIKRDSVDVFVQKPYEDEEICMVLIDPETEKNMIVWEKTENVATLKYQVFKMVGAGYVLVGERMFADSAWIIDYNSNPSSQADAYLLVTVDTCGNSSAMSKWHKPFLLQTSPGFDVINLNWSPYLIDNSEVISPGVHIFKSITIFRGTTSTSLSQIASVTAGIGNYIYTDNTAPLGIKMYYRIGGEKDPPCNPNNLPLKKASAGPFVHSFSNLEDNQRTTGTGMENTGDDVLIYPNPMSDRVTVKIGQHHTLPFRLRITDLSGRVIKETMQYEHIIELDRGNLSSGAYIIEVRGEVVYKGVLMVR